MTRKREFRFSGEALETRAGADAKPMIRGYAAKFNKLSEDLGWFREQIAPGAFKNSLTNDVRALIDHEPGKILGRTSAGTLKLNEDSIGLAFQIDPPDTQLCRDLMVSLQRGDVNQCSFGFFCREESWKMPDDPKGDVIRTILEADLFDVSIVTFPAYPDTSAQVRNCFPDGAPRRRNSAGCQCDCAECLANDCANCSDDACDDENCAATQRSFRHKMEMQLSLLQIPA